MLAVSAHTRTRHTQGRHPDPLDPETWSSSSLTPRDYTQRHRAAMLSPEMRAYANGLQLPVYQGDNDIRQSLLDDLSTYYKMPPEECIKRCLGWEEWSFEEWYQSQSMEDFYHSTQSWSFDLCWYAYLQATGFQYPVPVVVARSLPPDIRRQSGTRMLDFGSGVGDAAQLWLRLGFRPTLADVSTSLLDFAKFRLERRGDEACYLDLNKEKLAEAQYDLITAIDTLVLIPNFAEVVADLHRALRPNGMLYTTLDVRLSGSWHLYQDDLPLYWTLQRTGFEPVINLDRRVMGFRRVEPHGMKHQVRGLRDTVLLRSPLRPAYRSVRPWLVDLVERLPRPHKAAA
jgi:SAM-dependent methyltransferase